MKSYAEKESTSTLVSDYLAEAEALVALVNKTVADHDEIAFEQRELLTLADYAAQLHVGFVKHGFVLAMHLLMRHKDKEESEIYDFAMT